MSGVTNSLTAGFGGQSSEQRWSDAAFHTLAAYRQLLLISDQLFPRGNVGLVLPGHLIFQEKVELWNVLVKSMNV